MCNCSSNPNARSVMSRDITPKAIIQVSKSYSLEELNTLLDIAKTNNLIIDQSILQSAINTYYNNSSKFDFYNEIITIGDRYVQLGFI